MISELALAWARGRYVYQVRKGNVFGRSAEGPSPESFQVLNNAPFARFTEKEPQFKAGTWDHRNLGVHLISKFGTVPASEGLNNPNDLPTRLEASHAEGLGDKMGNQTL